MLTEITQDLKYRLSITALGLGLLGTVYFSCISVKDQHLRNLEIEQRYLLTQIKVFDSFYPKVDEKLIDKNALYQLIHSLAQDAGIDSIEFAFSVDQSMQDSSFRKMDLSLKYYTKTYEGALNFAIQVHAAMPNNTRMQILRIKDWESFTPALESYLGSVHGARDKLVESRVLFTYSVYQVKN